MVGVDFFLGVNGPTKFSVFGVFYDVQAGTYFDSKNIVNKELILFSMAAHQSSIPSVVDGLNTVQRNIMLFAFKNQNVQEVTKFIDYMYERSAYYHGKPNLATTMTGLAQNYVGSNNINLLSPVGAHNSYIFTKLSSITPHLFHESDQPLLKYLYEDGISIKPPNWYYPIFV